MTVQVGCGPTWTIDGPPPRPRDFTLLGASRVIEDLDAQQVERWVNGAKVYPYPSDIASVWDALSSGSDRVKTAGGTVPLPEFQSMVVYVAEKCTASGIFGGGMSDEEAQARFVERARVTLEAVESSAVEAELMAGAVLGANPHFADGATNDADHFPNGDTVTSIANAFATLENVIADLTGSDGVIHCSPGAALIASGQHTIRVIDRGPSGVPVLATINGTTVVPGAGYVGRSTPAGGHAAATGTEEWIYATGPVEIRRSAPFLVPETLAQATDRRDNLVTYLIERYYLADWDTTLQAAVLADRCKTTC